MRSVAALVFAVSLTAVPKAAAPLDDALTLAERLLERRDYPAAESALRAILKTDPANARVLGDLVLALLPQKKVREAVDSGRLAAAYAPEVPEARYIYGLALRAAGRNLDAAREFAKASALKPREAGPLEALAGAYAAADDERAIPAYERLLVLAPDRPGPPKALAESLWRAGQAERGNAVAMAAVERFPDDGSLRAAYGIALFEQQRFVDAAAQLSRARELRVRDARTLSVLGNALWQTERFSEARAVLKDAVREQPGSVALRLDVGRLCLSQGDVEPARVALGEAVQLAPKDATARFLLGQAAEADGRLTEAEEAYRAAVQLAPELASPRYALGRLLLRQGRREEGQKELAVYQSLYDRAVRRTGESNARDAQLALGWAELAKGDAAAALARFDALPDSSEKLVGRATALSRLRRHGEAVRSLERAREIDPENRRVQAQLVSERALTEETR